MVMAIFGVPLSTLDHINATAVLLFLPFVYLFGMLTDSLVQYPLDSSRKRIRDSLFKYENYKDEYIALQSPELYTAYEVRVRRVRVIGAAIFNWPLLGLALLLHIGFNNSTPALFVIIGALALSLISVAIWRGLYFRAYKYRKNACDVIRENLTK